MSVNTLPKAGRMLRAAVTLILTSTLAPALASDMSLEIDQDMLDARERFKAARDALSVADVDTFRRHKDTLTDYVLYPYLEYEDLAHEFRTQEPTKQSVRKLNAFESTYEEESLTRKLTRTLQSRLAETEQWKLFLGVSKSRVAAGGHRSGSHPTDQGDLGTYFSGDGRGSARVRKTDAGLSIHL